MHGQNHIKFEPACLISFRWKRGMKCSVLHAWREMRYQARCWFIIHIWLYLWVPGIFPREKRPESGADHPPLIELRSYMCRAIPSTSILCLFGVLRDRIYPFFIRKYKKGQFMYHRCLLISLKFLHVMKMAAQNIYSVCDTMNQLIIRTGNIEFHLLGATTRLGL